MGPDDPGGPNRRIHGQPRRGRTPGGPRPYRTHKQPCRGRRPRRPLALPQGELAAARRTERVLRAGLGPAPTFSPAGESRQRVRLWGKIGRRSHTVGVLRLTIYPLRTPVLRESLRRFCGICIGAGGTPLPAPRFVLPPCVLFLEISAPTIKSRLTLPPANGCDAIRTHPQTTV